jgi:hypothetical protein
VERLRVGGVAGWWRCRLGWLRRLEDADAVFGREPHAVVGGDVEGGVEGVEVAHRVAASLLRRVRVDGEEHLGGLLAGLAHPDLRPADEEPLVTGVAVEDRRLLVTEREPVCRVPDPDAGEVTDVLTDGEGTVDEIAWGRG